MAIQTKKPIKKSSVKKTIVSNKKTTNKKSLLRQKVKLPFATITIAIAVLVLVGGYIVINNSFAGNVGDVKNVPALSDTKFNSFVRYHMQYKGQAMPARYFPVIRKAIHRLGGNVFIDNILKKYPNTMLYVKAKARGVKLDSINAAAQAWSDNGQVFFDSTPWDTYDQKTVSAIIIHEYTHLVSKDSRSYTLAPDVSKKVSAYRQKSRNLASKEWSDYALTDDYEFIAVGVQYILVADDFDRNWNWFGIFTGESTTARLKRMQPGFYNYLVNDYIPWMYRRH